MRIFSDFSVETEERVSNAPKKNAEIKWIRYIFSVLLSENELS